MERTWKTKMSIVAYTLLLLFVSRAALYLVGYLGVNLFSPYTSKANYVTITEPFGQTHDQLQLPEKLEETRWIKPNELLKFDSLFYQRIAENGYDRTAIDNPHPPANWVFFPLYPLLVAALAKLTTMPLLHAGLLLSMLCLWGALIVIYWIGRERGLTDRQAKSVLFLVLLYPSSLYYSLMYTESLFLLLSAAAIYCAMRKQFAAALLLAGLSTVTRVPGVVNLLYVGGCLLLHKGRRWSWNDLRYAAYGAASLLPLLAYFAYMKQLTGDALAPMHEQTNWGREQSIPFEAFAHYWKEPYFILGGGWDNGFISMVMSCAVFLVFLAAAAMRLKWGKHQTEHVLFWIYGALLILIPFSSAPTVLTSVVRYMMVSLPLYFYLQRLSERWEIVGKTAVFLFAGIQVVVTIGFFNDYFFVV